MPNANDSLVKACVESVEASLTGTEAIVGIRRGLTIFSHNAQIPFLVDIAPLDGTGQVNGAKRLVVALVTSNTPHQVQLLSGATLPSVQWTPL